MSQEWLIEGEPNTAEWDFEEYRCQIVRHKELGHLCGYVAVPEGHPWFEKSYFDIDADVHGGLTFESYGHDEKHKDGYGYKPQTINGKKVWWVGFDCNHLHDIAPLADNSFHAFDAQYRTFGYVTSQTNELAAQARDAVEEADTVSE